MSNQPPSPDTPSTQASLAVKRLKTSCPICKRPSELDFRPFCSKRCSDVDLGRWMTESYAVPGHPNIDQD